MKPVTLRNITQAEWLPLSLEEFDEEPAAQDRAVAALIGAGPVADPWGEPIRELGKECGLSPDEAHERAEKLQTRNIVRIVDCEMGQPGPGIESFGKLKRWLRCKPAAKKQKL
jgi:hypothetical protein